MAVFAINTLPSKLTLTLSVRVAEAPLPRSPKFHTTVPAAPAGGALDGVGEALENVVPPGPASTDTFLHLAAGGLFIVCIPISTAPMSVPSPRKALAGNVAWGAVSRCARLRGS